MASFTSKEDHVAVEIERFEMNPNWVSSIRKSLQIDTEKLGGLSSSKSCSIYRVPRSIRPDKKKTYDPQIISIGPLHYQKRENKLQAMEEHKRRYLRDILSRNGQSSLERYLATIKQSEEEARRCYSEVIELDSDSFVEMMLLDCCFIIEFIRKTLFREYDGDDPIFQLGWLKNAITTDLIRLENQIPFFILPTLFHLICPMEVTSRFLFIQMVVDFYFGEDVFITANIIKDAKEVQHLLHLHHTCLTFNLPDKKEGSSNIKTPSIPCASDLQEAGIKFKELAVNPDSSTRVEFQEREGVIEISPIKIFDKTNTELLNFITFEQCSPSCKRYISSYISFLKSLIKSVKDVKILCEAGILGNQLGTNEEVVAVFNNLLREVTSEDDGYYLSDLYKQINYYRKLYWPKTRATLVHDYFKNPWAIISFCAAVVLLVLSVLQTFFSAFPKFSY